MPFGFILVALGIKYMVEEKMCFVHAVVMSHYVAGTAMGFLREQYECGLA